tara:strand:- start:318 stop:512 length:195 start_codon:yes stop_codon:yes gene_type:complete
MTNKQKEVFDILYNELSFMKSSLRAKCPNAIKLDDTYHRIVLRLAKNYNGQSIDGIIKFMKENN